MALVIGMTVAPRTTSAQTVGTFRWQTQPYCNVITVTIEQQGDHYLVDGTDEQCGATQKAAVQGLAFLNPDGTIGFGLNVVTSPGGAPVHLDATISLATLGGTWRDSAGRTGAFVFGPGTAGLPPRPAGGLGAASVNTAQVQRRVTGACSPGQSMSAVGEDGTVTCQAVSGSGGGDITGVAAGPGLLGGGTAGDVSLAVAFAGPGTASAAAHSDHRHEVGPTGVAIGAGALAAQTTGSRNTATGSSAMAAETSGVANTAVGNAALANHATGNGNVALGDSALASMTSGNYIVAVGYGALAANTSGTTNTAVGTSALNANTTGAGNTANGYEALLGNTTGGRNTAFGATALRGETTGVANTAVGNGALASHATGNGNVAIGDSALTSKTSGSFAVAVGYGALASSTTGLNNTAIGTSALNANTIGGLNTATGFEALLSNTGGDQNTAAGYKALRANQGSGNTALGAQALSDGTTGSDNVAVGAAAGFNLLSGSNNIYVGAGAVGATSESNTMRLGRSDLLSRTFIAGIRGRTTGSADAIPVVIDSSGQLGTISSSRRTKDQIRDLGSVSRSIFDLRPVSFIYKPPFADGSTPIQYGLIAEEVESVLPELVAYGADGQPETVKYHILPTLLLAEVQRLERERAAQQEAIAALRAVVDQLRRQLAVRSSTIRSRSTQE